MGVTAVPGDSIAATDPFAGNAKVNPPAPKPATLKTDKALFDRLPFEVGFICDILRLHHQARAAPHMVLQSWYGSFVESWCMRCFYFSPFRGKLIASTGALVKRFASQVQAD
jgi:hypothetical protein